jgi:GH15 family glucan-1,4-alpha-glucosidase
LHQLASMRIEGYSPIADYALVGDGRTAALVSRDGAIDWLCLPNMDSPSAFGALIDAERGGSFSLRPSVPFESRRRYIPSTNVLETTFHTAVGVVRLTDALTLPDDGLEPARELVRRVEGLSGEVPMEWCVSPRFDYGRVRPVCRMSYGVPVAGYGSQAIAVRSWDAGSPSWRTDAVLESRFTARAGSIALVSLGATWAEPLVFPARSEVEHRLEETIHFWQEWTASCHWNGPWREPVERSALLLKSLIYAPSGAPVAAPTTSLPEQLGGVRNWDYRFCWIRDSNFIVDALLELGCYREAQSFFWWFMQATALTRPNIHVLYRLDGGLAGAETSLPFSGYRGSRPVRAGNAAAVQRQLDVFGDLFETAWLYSEGHQPLDRDTGAAFAELADQVCRVWRRPDAGIWEVRNGPFHFTHSKGMCWVALDRAMRLAERGEIPSRHVGRWHAEARAIRQFIEGDCWSERRQTYTRAAGDERVDASLLLLSLTGYGDPAGPRLTGTIEAIRRDLLEGDFVYRYKASDGLPGQEGCFLNCSFWLAAALARAGRVAEATRLMDRLTRRANDVGLYSEEIDPATGTFLGNFPQALVHLALIHAATCIGRAESGSASRRRTTAA